MATRKGFRNRSFVKCTKFLLMQKFSIGPFMKKKNKSQTPENEDSKLWDKNTLLTTGSLRNKIITRKRYSKRNELERNGPEREGECYI